jgi:hypothetical protein
MRRPELSTFPIESWEVTKDTIRLLARREA